MNTVKLGRYNQLKIVKEVDFGIYLDGGEDGEILLPMRYVPAEHKVDDILNVFIYRDSEDRVIATTETPLAQVGDFAYLEVKSVNSVGAFMDWGLMKDLFVPFKEQKAKMLEGGWYVVYLYIDYETDRIAASAKIDRYLSKEMPSYQVGDETDVMVYQYSDLGFKVIVDNKFGGILYENEVFKELEIGQKMKAYIKQVREDGKIDLIVDKPGYEKVGGVAKEILKKIAENDGFLSLSDKSPAEDIYEAFGVSKKTYKKAIGDLYKHRLIQIEPQGIRVVSNERKRKIKL